VIVRISGEGQWRVPDSDRERLNELDNEIAKALDGCSQDEFKALLGRLADEVRSRGERVPDEELATSDVVLPAIDTTVEEARELFAGEGLIAD
jgi:hypothetical protein